LRWFRLFLLFLQIFFTLQSCVYLVWRKELSREEKADDAFLLSLFGLLDNPNQAIYSFQPGNSRNLSNDQYLEPELVPITSKPKLVLIHGWNPLERDADPFTSRAKKIGNINGTFRNAILHFQENQGSSKANYDMYLFTYRTSNGIVFNGDGFLNYLKKTFSTTDKVYVISHSMGGLVTRAAMKSNSYLPGLIDGVVTLGSPMYGSPFASKSYIKSQSFVSEISSFLIETQGGTDLSHTNNGLNQMRIEDDRNLVLDFINDGFSYNDLFISYSGVLSPACNGAETFYYTTSCNLLSNSNPSFPLNDGIVPENSALLGEQVGKNFRKVGYDHSMMAFQTEDVDNSKSVNFFKEVILQVDLLRSK
jgi:hypothetical protein